MSTIGEVRAMRDRARDEQDAQERSRLLAIAQQALSRLEAAHVARDCPDWCNAHLFTYGDWSPTDDVDEDTGT